MLAALWIFYAQVWWAEQSILQDTTSQNREKKAKISRKCTFDILADRDHDKIQSERHDMFKFVLVETLLNIAELGANSSYYVIFFIIIS